ncbi:MAG: carbamoyltransferase [Leptospiraceae bacterium]|nr:carbamoyltransferase [Leptospiraceae bacterium]MBK7056666.1 carbamoyltransferase [Leptospiraceae bacterium]MBK9498340.1 carbamoyltransferase [Leptospiraceae bacterium]MBP9162541.1 carbamoyltransferase [Leptospiraceae bacterium]
MNILGISCFYHDSAAAILKNGEVIAAAQEERFTRKRHDANFPNRSIEYCLQTANIKVSDLDYVAFYDKPFLKFERIIESALSAAPKGLPTFMKAIPIWMSQKLFAGEEIKKQLGKKEFKGKLIFPEHHESHAAAAFFPSPYLDAAFLTVDGVGEWTTTSFGVGRDNRIEILSDIKFPHSLGLLYSAITYYTGFKVNSGEYKVMGLAPYGEPKYVQLILDNLIDLKEDGSYKINLEYFDYIGGEKMTNKKFDQLFGAPARKPETKLAQREMDLARSIQEVVEIVVLKMAKHIHKTTGMKNLCLSGGVALNCVANGKILREGPFDDIWIQPASGDAGSALGAALITHYHVNNAPRKGTNFAKMQKASYLGPEYSEEYIENYLKTNNIPYEKVAKTEVAKRTAKVLSEEKVVGWFQGRMEFGPRALGARSIIGDPRSQNMQSIMNLKIKFRESFRPFAPSVLREDVSKYFEHNGDSPYMLIVAPVKDSIRIKMTPEQEKLFGIEKLNVPRSTLPSITHVDYSARIQTVTREDHAAYYDLISEFKKLTGCSVVVNTSFNVRGEPIVCTPEDAYRCFMRTNMDYLVVENFILDKTKQPELKNDNDWKNEFELD